MSAPDTSTAAVERLLRFLRETAQYFARRPTNGEDAAVWANAANADNAMRCEAALAALAAERDALRAALASGPVTKADLAEAFGCMWNAALGVSNERQEAIAVASMLAEGFHAMAQSLKPAALTPKPESR